MLSRREFLTQIAIGSIFLNACRSSSGPDSEVFPKTAESPIPVEQFMDSKLQIYAKELAGWVLKDGTRMADFTEVRKAIDILSGKIDPRIYVPFAKPPMIFLPVSNSGGAFTRHLEYETNSTERGIVVSLPTGEKLPYFWLSNERSRSEIKLETRVQNNTVRMPVLVKEVSQVYDLPEYYRLYMRLAEEQGISYSYINENSIPTSGDEILANACEALSLIEKERTGNSFLNDIIDVGSHLRVGGFLFASWYQDQLNRGLKPDESSIVNRVGKTMMVFLTNKRLIVLNGNHYDWINGKSPDIDSKEFLDLFKEMSGKSGLILKK